jgi:inhibitor of cysteine peptidase
MVDLVLTEADAGRTVEVAPRTAVQLRLPENPTTGYRWVLTLAPADCARIDGDRYLAPSGEAVGAGGLRVIGIAAVTASPCVLDLAYRRPWEREAPAAKAATFRLVTAPAN